MIRFAIRDLLWLTLTAGLALALWMERSEAAAIREERDGVQEALDRVQEVLARHGYEVRPGCWGWILIQHED